MPIRGFKWRRCRHWAPTTLTSAGGIIGPGRSSQNEGTSRRATRIRSRRGVHECFAPKTPAPVNASRSPACGSSGSTRPVPDAVRAPVPASYNDVFADATVRDHVGDAWYQTTARVPRGWEGQRVVLRFDSATHRAVVWVGDTKVAEHEGGYTPFEADVTSLLAPGDP